MAGLISRYARVLNFAIRHTAPVMGSRNSGALPFGLAMTVKRLRSSPSLKRMGSSKTMVCPGFGTRSEEHTSELQSLMRISYAVFFLKKKTKEYKEEKAT